MELAYIFWHHRRHAASEEQYREGLLQYHDSLAEHPTAGFISSFSRRYNSVPWIDSVVEVYEDWYIVEDFGALGRLNNGAHKNGHAESHGEMARMAEGGAGGVYQLWFNYGGDDALKTVVRLSCY